MRRAVVLARLFGPLFLIISFAVVVPIQSLPFASILGPNGSLVDGSQHPEPSVQSGVLGNVSISNIVPLCYVPAKTTPSNDNTTVVVFSLLGQETIIPVSWSIIGGCLLFGTFKASLDPGRYLLTLSYCLETQAGAYQPAGCPHAACGLQSCNLPITIDVWPGKLTPVSIDITTGIY